MRGNTSLGNELDPQPTGFPRGAEALARRRATSFPPKGPAIPDPQKPDRRRFSSKPNSTSGNICCRLPAPKIDGGCLHAEKSSDGTGRCGGS